MLLLVEFCCMLLQQEVVRIACARHVRNELLHAAPLSSEHDSKALQLLESRLQETDTALRLLLLDV